MSVPGTRCQKADERLAAAVAGIERSSAAAREACAHLRHDARAGDAHEARLVDALALSRRRSTVKL